MTGSSGYEKVTEMRQRRFPADALIKTSMHRDIRSAFGHDLEKRAVNGVSLPAAMVIGEHILSTISCPKPPASRTIGTCRRRDPGCIPSSEFKAARDIGEIRRYYAADACGFGHDIAAQAECDVTF